MTWKATSIIQSMPFAEPGTSNLLALAKLFGISAGELLREVE